MLKGITDVWDEDLAGIVSDLEYEVLSKTSDTMNIYIVGFTDSIRNDIKDDVGASALKGISAKAVIKVPAAK